MWSLYWTNTETPLLQSKFAPDPGFVSGTGGSPADRWVRANRARCRMAPQNAVVRTLHRAARMLGGSAPLAAKLKCEKGEVERWMAGIPPPPEYLVFIHALDIVARG